MISCRSSLSESHMGWSSGRMIGSCLLPEVDGSGGGEEPKCWKVGLGSNGMLVGGNYR
jgi:hypothetical protein